MSKLIGESSSENSTSKSKIISSLESVINFLKSLKDFELLEKQCKNPNLINRLKYSFSKLLIFIIPLLKISLLM